jgi:hypothetical protein
MKIAYTIVLSAFPQKIRMIKSAATIPYDIYYVIIRLYRFAMGVCKIYPKVERPETILTTYMSAGKYLIKNTKMK